MAEHAVILDPDNHELLANLALAHLLAGNVTAAERAIEAAMKRNSTDSINSYLNKVIHEVATGRRQHPESIQDLHSQPHTMQPTQRRASHKKFWQFWKK